MDIWKVPRCLKKWNEPGGLLFSSLLESYLSPYTENQESVPKAPFNPRSCRNNYKTLGYPSGGSGPSPAARGGGAGRGALSLK